MGRATAQSANREEERNRQRRGLTDLSGVCTCEGNRQMGQIKEQRDRHKGRKKIARGQSGRGQGCTECLGLSGPNTPNPGGHWLMLYDSQPPIGQCLGRSHTLGWALSLQPAARGHCHTVLDSSLVCRADRAAAGGGTD